VLRFNMVGGTPKALFGRSGFAGSPPLISLEFFVRFQDLFIALDSSAPNTD